MKHPCQNQCPNFTDEQCCHCLIHQEEKLTDEDKYLALALEAVKQVP